MLSKLFGTRNSRELKRLAPLVKAVAKFEPQLQQLSDAELKAQTDKFRTAIQSNTSLEALLPEAFATVREASVRCLGMRHYDVQILGGIILFRGIIAEMKTGEGKTLTATLPLYLRALEGKGAHLVTVNEYLAARDAEEMGVLFNWLGLSTGVIKGNMTNEEKQHSYACDITYGTNNEFGFDYLRDNLNLNLDEYFQRGHHYCIVDEVDSILIDEARTPLIISGPSEGNTDLYNKANTIIPQLNIEEHYTVDEKSKSAVFTEAGNSRLQEITGIADLYQAQHMELLHCINQSLRAHALYTKDVDYVVKEDEVIIVDEFTGRLKTGSRWADGLHQAVEAKERVAIKKENQTLASITFQNYFKLYSTLAGMTGTAETEAEEFRKIYNLDVNVVPTNKPMIRKDQPDIIYKTKKGKIKAIADLLKELYEKGQPVLVGTISIESSEEISVHLKKMGVPHEILNAKQHEREASIIVNAGKKKSITIATNMAGRGTDIKLGDGVIDLGGLFILGTERHESRRIDNQLRGRSGRQGDPGESRFFLSLEDDLLRIFGSDRIKNIMNAVGMEDDEPIESKMISKQIAKAQMKVENHNFDIRKHLLDYDNVMNEQRRVIYRVRRDIISDKDNLGFVFEMMEDFCHSLVETYRPEKKVPLEAWPWDEINTGFNNIFKTERKLTAEECTAEHEGELATYITHNAKEILTEKFAQYPDEQVTQALREILLQIFNQYWKDHLLNMDHLREGINLQSFAQKDPLNEYKHKAFALFENMREEIKRAVVETVYGVHLYTEEEIEQIKRQQQAQMEAQMEAHKRAQMAQEKTTPVKRKTNKVGRNEPCPCGSGKKFKHCHGA